MAGYNRTRYVEELLEKTEALPPSFTVHLHLEYWTLNQGSKFLYNNQIASLLDDIRAHRIPVDFLDLFDAARVPFYDGCMIVELLDYRPQRNKEPTLEKPERTRAVLQPNSETLWADICSLNQRYGSKWSDQDALDIEARLLLAISPPLCLEPDPHLTRIANHVLRVSTPTVPVSLKRKAATLDPEEDETDKARRTKIMQFMSPQSGRIHAPSYRILEAIQNSRQVAAGKPSTPLPNNNFVSNSQQPSPTKPPTPSQIFSQAQPQNEIDSKQDVKMQKAETPKTSFATAALARPTSSQASAPPQATHQFINHLQVTNNPSPTPHAQSPMPPHAYPAATDASKSTPTPRPPSSQAPVPSHPPPIPQGAARTPTPTFQAAMPGHQFLNAPPLGARSVAPKPQTGNAPVPPHISYNQTQYMYAQQQQAVLMQQRLNGGPKNGRSTPQGGQSAPSPARGSPMVPNKTLAARSPMPPHVQPAPPKHPPQHPQTTFTPSYNPAALRPMVHGNPSQPMPAHMANMGAGIQSNGSPLPPTGPDGQPQLHSYPQMYGYAPINYPSMQAGPGRMAPTPAYWQIGMGVGRGAPSSVNGQPIPGMAAMTPQMPVGGAKAGTAGVPGR